MTPQSIVTYPSTQYVTRYTIGTLQHNLSRITLLALSSHVVRRGEMRNA